MAQSRSQWKTIEVAREGDSFRCCGADVPVGATVRWHRSKGIEHLRGECARELLDQPPLRGQNAQDDIATPEEGRMEGPKPKWFPARYQSECLICKTVIGVGDPQFWVKGKGASHRACGEVVA
jgi:hypothetical protein